MTRTASMQTPSRTPAITPAPEFAPSGWVVEARLADAGEASDLRFFAVGMTAAAEAEEAVLRYPGMLREDRRLALRPLTREEIARLGLRAEAVRPYGRAFRG